MFTPGEASKPQPKPIKTRYTEIEAARAASTARRRLRASHAGGRHHPGRDRCLLVDCAFVTRDLKPQTGRHARGAARPASVARPPHACLERSRAPLPLPPRGRAGRVAAAHAPARSNTSAATARTLIRPPHREVQRPAAPRFWRPPAAPVEQHHRSRRDARPAASQVASERRKKGRTRWQLLRRLGRGE